MSEFILEIYGEEIPSSAQSLIENQFEKLFCQLLENNEIKFKELTTFSTSRRVGIYIYGFNNFTNSKQIEVRGPQINANEKAIQGFLKSNNLSDIKQLEKKVINDKSYFIFKKKIKNKNILEVFYFGVPNILQSIKWIKSMRWGNHSDRWIRPIKNILCVYNRKLLKIKFADLESKNFTFGNYHFDENKFKYNNYLNYRKKLKENFVILEGVTRQKHILKSINAFCKKNNLKFVNDLTFLNRVSNSVEYPNVYFGKFDKKFFKIPEFLMKNIMSDKQDYFIFKGQNNKLTNFFGFVSGIKVKKQNKLVESNINVLKARFSDASFFINEDKKKGLTKRLEKLKEIVFYEQTGSLFDRACRIKGVAKFIYEKLGRDDQFENYLIYSNTDLTTDLVKEFPSLQGKVGGFLSSFENFPKTVSKAFSDQYEYEFGKSYDNFLTFVLSISQKFDSILGYFVTKESLTGAGDPFGIRRSTLSIIKICIEKKINLKFSQLFDFNKDLYLAQNINLKIKFSFLFNFFKKRIVNFFREMGFRNDIILASIDKEFNPYSIFIRANEITKLCDSADGKKFLKAFKRLNSLNEDIGNQNFEINLLTMEEEKKFYNLFHDIKKKIKELKHNFIFQDLKYLNQLSNTINIFFDNVIVNDNNLKIRKNRKILINKFHKILNDNYRFSSLEI